MTKEKYCDECGEANKNVKFIPEENANLCKQCFQNIISNDNNPIDDYRGSLIKDPLKMYL